MTAEVEGDTSLIKERLKSLLAGEHPLVAARALASPDRASFLLACARNGFYDFEKLAPLALGVELLAEAVRDHFERMVPRGKGDPSLPVLGGDRIYALGMQHICSSGRADLIAIASKTVADIAEREAEGGAENAPTLERRLAREERIFRAALDMAAAAANIPAAAADMLEGHVSAAARSAIG